MSSLAHYLRIPGSVRLLALLCFLRWRSTRHVCCLIGDRLNAIAQTRTRLGAGCGVEANWGGTKIRCCDGSLLELEKWLTTQEGAGAFWKKWEAEMLCKKFTTDLSYSERSKVISGRKPDLMFIAKLNLFAAVLEVFEYYRKICHYCVPTNEEHFSMLLSFPSR